MSTSNQGVDVYVFCVAGQKTKNTNSIHCARRWPQSEREAGLCALFGVLSFTSSFIFMKKKKPKKNPQQGTKEWAHLIVWPVNNLSPYDYFFLPFFVRSRSSNNTYLDHGIYPQLCFLICSSIRQWFCFLVYSDIMETCGFCAVAQICFFPLRLSVKYRKELQLELLLFSSVYRCFVFFPFCSNTLHIETNRNTYCRY